MTWAGLLNVPALQRPRPGPLQDQIVQVLRNCLASFYSRMGCTMALSAVA